MAASRREMIYRMTLTSALASLSPVSLWGEQRASTVRFGVITDVHQDIMPDGVERLQAFIKAMDAEKPDFVIQLGDFCVPHERNRAFLETWNACSVPHYHVLGNHDMDGGYRSEQTVKFYGMSATYYAFTAGPIRCVVLNGNEPGGKAKGYKRYIAAEQLVWLERELSQADRPVVVFVHQPLDGEVAESGGYIENANEVRGVLERAAAAQAGRIVSVFSGHLHLDYARTVNGIRHVQINSASYYWLNHPAAHRETYPADVHKKHPYLKHVAAYREPLWGLVTLDFERGEMTLEGRTSEWVGPDPWERGEKLKIAREELHPAISDLRVNLAALK